MSLVSFPAVQYDLFCIEIFHTSMISVVIKTACILRFSQNIASVNVAVNGLVPAEFSLNRCTAGRMSLKCRAIGAFINGLDDGAVTNRH
jgi:hypothetical protein